jgi:hypothetical protein
VEYRAISFRGKNMKRGKEKGENVREKEEKRKGERKGENGSKRVKMKKGKN